MTVSSLQHIVGLLEIRPQSAAKYFSVNAGGGGLGDGHVQELADGAAFWVCRCDFRSLYYVPLCVSG